MMPRLPLLGLPTYGLLVALGFIAALLLAWRLAPRCGLSPHVVQDVLVWTSLWAIVGAKLLLVALDPLAFVADPWALLFQGGVFYGGAIAGLIGGWVRARQLGLDPWAVADVVAPCVALAHAFGRLGCFLAGCCYGAACEAPWAVHFSDPLSTPLLAGVRPEQGLHPTQLYEALGNLGLLAGLLVLLPRRAFAGQAWWLYAAGYALLRLLIETVRGDERGSIGGLSTSQVIAIGALAASAGMLVALPRRRAQVAAPGGGAPSTPEAPGPSAGSPS